MKRQDQLLAHMDAYAVDKKTNAMLLQYEGETLSTSSKIVKSKLLAIDPTTKALLVKFGNQLPWQVLDPNPEFTTLKVGTEEGYAQISSIGQLTLSGRGSEGLTLRPELQQEEIRKVLKPDSIYVGAFYGYSLPIYAADNEELFFKQRVPVRWDGESDIHVHMIVALSDAEDVGDNFRFQLSWQHCGCHLPNPTVRATTFDVEMEQAVLVGRSAQYSVYLMHFLIDYDIEGAGSEIHSQELLAFRIRRIAATAPQVANEILVFDTVTVYRRDKLGMPWEEVV